MTSFDIALKNYESIYNSTCDLPHWEYKFKDVNEWETTYGKSFEEYKVAVRQGILSNKEYFMDKVIEECSEVIKELMKCKLFGIEHNYTGEKNIDKFKRELADLQDTLRVFSEIMGDETLNKLTVETDSLEYRRERLLIYALYVEGITKDF